MSLQTISSGPHSLTGERLHPGALPAQFEFSDLDSLQHGFFCSVAWALRLTLLLWLTHFLVSMGLGFKAGSSYEAYVAHLGFQFLLICASWFLFTVTRVASSGIYWILGMQALAGAIALQYNGNSSGTVVRTSWMVTNLLAAMLLTIAMAARAYLPRHFPTWAALAGGLFGLGLSIRQLMLADAAEDSTVLSRHWYVLLLLVVWQLVTQHWRQILPGANNSSQTSNGEGTGATACAVRLERSRIAQDLHDGVASQIVGILSTLDPRAPEQQALGLALEQCLLDMKLTIDGIEFDDQSVVEALGTLRYRIRLPLDKLGIQLVWDVEDCTALEVVRGEEARQVLRIAQECLSNIMRHAEATEVVVSCRYIAGTGCMELAVRDNGVGVAHELLTESTGKGLDNMRHRARQIGGQLTITSKFQSGSRVLLSLPLDPEFCALSAVPSND